MECSSVNYLVLVNKTHAIPSDWDERIHLVPVNDRNGQRFLLEEKTAEAFESLRTAMEKQGLIIEIVSGYRSRKDQEETIREIAAEEGLEAAMKRCAKPGFSEHETGLALDVSYDRIFGELLMRWNPVFAEYGFIHRYPKGKEDLTGYPEENWHLRYVGTEHSRMIEAKSLTLEEYLTKRHIP
ncbi:MAG: M15 family metallopeptidase [Solobacterium sp.]|nr:M15 family metallopeptidase [Solobacterium sp.]